MPGETEGLEPELSGSLGILPASELGPHALGTSQSSATAAHGSGPEGTALAATTDLPAAAAMSQLPVLVEDTAPAVVRSAPRCTPEKSTYAPPYRRA